MEFRPALIRGKTIEPEVDSGLSDGQRVEVVILPVPRERVPGEGILRTAGSLADDLGEIRRARGAATAREIPG